jgi:hypothetical protein
MTVLTGEESAGLLKAGYLGINRRLKIGCIHAVRVSLSLGLTVGKEVSAAAVQAGNCSVWVFSQAVSAECSSSLLPALLWRLLLILRRLRGNRPLWCRRGRRARRIVSIHCPIPFARRVRTLFHDVASFLG